MEVSKVMKSGMSPLIVRKGTLQELFTFNDWARDKLMACAVNLTDEQLDRPFEMGEGSIRRTMNHLRAVEWVWLDRWQLKPQPRYRLSADGVTMPQLWEEFREHARERDAYLSGKTDADLARPVAFTSLAGKNFTMPLGPLMLHVCNHGSHHRAQATNMLRRVGAAIPKPGADYIFMKIENPEGTPCVLDADTIRSYFQFSDWARDRVLNAAGTLSDEQLDRPFEMGLGTLRKTLGHIRDAEQWWLSSWTSGPAGAFPPANDKTPVAEIARLSAETAAGRNEILRNMTGEGLRRMVSAKPRPEVTRTFPIGVTMLQLCHHGTHHRAQALNMLRHTSGAKLEMDLPVMLREL